MNDLIRTRLSVIWLLLIVATLLSFESALGLGHVPGHIAGSIVLVIAFVKVRLVGAEFMELRQAPQLLGWLFDGWVALICAVLITIYWMGGGAA